MSYRQALKEITKTTAKVAEFDADYQDRVLDHVDSGMNVWKAAAEVKREERHDAHDLWENPGDDEEEIKFSFVSDGRKITIGRCRPGQWLVEEEPNENEQLQEERTAQLVQADRFKDWQQRIDDMESEAEALCAKVRKLHRQAREETWARRAALREELEATYGPILVWVIVGKRVSRQTEEFCLGVASFLGQDEIEGEGTTEWAAREIYNLLGGNRVQGSG